MGGELRFYPLGNGCQKLVLRVSTFRATTVCFFYLQVHILSESAALDWM